MAALISPWNLPLYLLSWKVRHRQRQTDREGRQGGRDREGETERERQRGETEVGRETERERETDRQTDRQRQTDRETDKEGRQRGETEVGRDRQRDRQTEGEIMDPLLICTASFSLLSSQVAPALAAGCTMVAKPSEFTPTTASLLCEAGNDNTELRPY